MAPATSTGQGLSGGVTAPNSTEVADSSLSGTRNIGWHGFIRRPGGRKSDLDRRTGHPSHDLLHDGLGRLGPWRVVAVPKRTPSAQSRLADDNQKEFGGRVRTRIRPLSAGVSPSIFRSAGDRRAGRSEAEEHLGSLGSDSRSGRPAG